MRYSQIFLKQNRIGETDTYSRDKVQGLTIKVGFLLNHYIDICDLL